MRARLVAVLLVCAISRLPVLVAAVPPPAAVRSVQVAACRTDEPKPEQIADFEATKARLAEQGIGPVWEFQRDEGKLGTWNYLLVGRLERFIDAYVIKNELREAGFAGAYEVAYVREPSENFSTEIQGVQLDYPIVFPKESRSPLEYRTSEANTLLAEIAEAGSREDEVRVLAAIDGMQDNDPNKGDLLAGLADRMYRNRFSFGAKTAGQAWPADRKTEVRSLYKDVLSGKYAISQAAFEQAAWNFSVYVHEVEESRVATYRLHRALLERYRDRPGYAARSQVMMVATLMELVGAEKGYYNEARRMAEIALEDIPSEYRKARSVIKLMAAESYFREGEYQRAVDEFDRILAPGDLTERELIASRYMKSKALMKLDRNEEALDVLLENMALLPTTENTFMWAGEVKNTAYISMEQARSLAARLGRGELAEEIEKYLGELAKIDIPLDEESIYFPDSVFMYTEEQLAARAQRGSMDHACICPFTSQWVTLYECAHFTPNPGEACSTTQCIKDEILYGHCTQNPDAPANPTGALDCPPGMGPNQEVVNVRQWLYQKNGGGTISGCPNDTPYKVYNPSVACQWATYSYRCQIGNCGGTGYTLVATGAERKAVIPYCP